MKPRYLFLATVLLLLAAGAAWGEFYQYTDEAGVVRFTDDPSLIPEDQRPSAQTFESIRPSAEVQEEPSEAVPEEVVQKPEAVVEESASGVETPAGKIRARARELDAVREDLFSEYNALQAEKKALGPPPPENAKSGVKADYVYRITDLNRRIEAYQQRALEFDKQVNAFNAEIGRKQKREVGP